MDARITDVLRPLGILCDEMLPANRQITVSSDLIGTGAYGCEYLNRYGFASLRPRKGCNIHLHSRSHYSHARRAGRGTVLTIRTRNYLMSFWRFPDRLDAGCHGHVPMAPSRSTPLLLWAQKRKVHNDPEETRCMLGCTEYSARIERFVDGEMSKEESEGLFSHLMDCPPCAIAMEESKALSFLIRAAHPRITAPASLRFAVLQMLRGNS
jgi:hypothetical protein